MEPKRHMRIREIARFPLPPLEGKEHPFSVRTQPLFLIYKAGEPLNQDTHVSGAAGSKGEVVGALAQRARAPAGWLVGTLEVLGIKCWEGSTSVSQGGGAGFSEGSPGAGDGVSVSAGGQGLQEARGGSS